MLPCYYIRDSLLTPSAGSMGSGRGSAGKIFATMVLHLWFSLIDMQHDRVLKKNRFDLLNPTAESGGEGGV